MIEEVIRALIKSAVREALAEYQDKATNRQPEPNYMVAREAAAYASVSIKTIRAWAKQGRIPSFKEGRILRIRRRDIDMLLSDGCVRPGPTPAEVAASVLNKRK